MKCSRRTCPFGAVKRGMCKKHHTAWCAQNPTVPAALVADHINQLRASGMTGEYIAELAGVAITEVYALIRGERIYVLADVAAKIRAVGYVPPLDRNPTSLLPIIGTARRLQALTSLGWTTTRLAAELGVHINNVPRLMLQRQPYATVASARAVDAMYRRLMFASPPDELGAKRARARAARAGWVPPLAWDDDIDDPNATPDLGRVVETGEKVIDLRQEGLSDVRIAEVLGIRVDSVQQSARRYERKLAS